MLPFGPLTWQIIDVVDVAVAGDVKGKSWLGGGPLGDSGPLGGRSRYLYIYLPVYLSNLQNIHFNTKYVKNLRLQKSQPKCKKFNLVILLMQVWGFRINRYLGISFEEMLESALRLFFLKGKWVVSVLHD